MHWRNSGNQAPVKAGIYCRISLARDGDTTKTGDQERICRELAERLGWEIIEGHGHPRSDGVYTDPNKSAWQLNRKRPAWEQMLADIDAGHVSAIVIYHGDRLLRTHEDLLELIRRARTRGIQLASPAGTRDIGNYDDQFILEIEASMAKRESANTSRRRKQQYERWRMNGRVRPGGRGGRAFGFCTDNATLYPADRCDVATREEVSEADVIRETATRILAGEGPYGIARDLTARGWRTSAGGPLTQRFIRRMITKPRYVGLMPDGESGAAWPAILDRETWERVKLMLDARGLANPAPSNARRWLLSGLAVCGMEDCGLPLQRSNTTAFYANGRHAYTGYGCPKGHLRRRADHLDAYVGRMTVRRMNDRRNPPGELPVPAPNMAEWAALAESRRETETQLREYTAPGIAAPLAARLARIDTRMAELREREAGDARSRLLGQYQGITWEQFCDLPLDVRRALVSACFRVIVLPASKRGPGFRTEDVRLDPL